MYRHDNMNILGIFILLFVSIRSGEAQCPDVKDGNCKTCSNNNCTTVECDDGWFDRDNNATTGCETSNTALDYCPITPPSSISHCTINADFTVAKSSFSLQNRAHQMCYCTSTITLERYLIGPSDKCYNGKPQYRQSGTVPVDPAYFQSDVNLCLNTASVDGECTLFAKLSKLGTMENWDTSKIVNMSGAFQNKATFDADLSKWDTSKVVDMSDMFEGATAFDANLSQWDVSKVTEYSNFGMTADTLKPTFSTQICSRGYYRSTNDASGVNTTCDPCDAGTFQDGTDSTVCKDCAVGTFQNDTGSTSCKDCTAGKYQSQQGQASCTDCSSGTYSGQKATECQVCIVGKHVNGANTTCVDCAAGKYQDRADQTECKVCPTKIIKKESVDQYQDARGQTSCKDCIGTVLSRTSCFAKCKVGNRQHICPILGFKNKPDFASVTCENGVCTDNDCCETVSGYIAKKNNEKNDMTGRFSSLITELGEELNIKNTGETTADAIARVLNEIEVAVNTKINANLVNMNTESDEEKEQAKIESKKKSHKERMEELRDNVIDLSGLNFQTAQNAVKEAIKQAEKQDAAIAKEAAKVARKQLAIASRGIKEILKSNMKTAQESVTTASNDDLALVVATSDVAVLNSVLDAKVAKLDMQFMRLKLAKDHSVITATYNWSDFDCENADLNLDKLGLFDFDEVLFDVNETAVACNLGNPVTYVEKVTNNVDDYNDYNVYCCGESSRRLMRRRLTRLTCTQQYKANQSVAWNEHDSYTCPATGDYPHIVMSLGGMFTGCYLELNGTVGWVYDSPGRTLGNCGASQCTGNNTNVTCLYFQESCQPSCEAGYASDGASLTCSGGDQYSTSETTCTGCTAGTYAGAGATTCTDCPVGKYSNELAEQCTNCPTGKYVAASGKMQCYDVTDIATELLNDQTGVRCSFSGEASYDNDGQYVSGCTQKDGSVVKIVMFGVVSVKNSANTTCEKQCAKWYGNLENGFVDPSKSNSTVSVYRQSALYCQYLLWTSVPIKSDVCST